MTERKVISIRISEAGLAEIDKIAADELRARGDMIRMLIADGIKQYRRKRA